MTSVAPNCAASVSLVSTVSMAMIRKAPANAAPWMQFNPTPPQPTTATVLPGSTFAVFNAAPKPVVAPHPINASRSKGTSSCTFTTAFSCTSISSAYDPSCAICVTASPCWLNRGGSSRPRVTSIRLQRLGCPRRQNSQCPQNTDRHMITESPGFT